MTEATTRRRGRDDTAAQVAGLAPWFHNIHLPDGTQTMPDHWLGGDFPRFKWDQIAPWLPDRLDGLRALDVGCNAGFYTVELARRGAEVVAIDLDEHYLRQARWVAAQFELQDRIEFRRMQVHEIGRTDDHFDIVWFMGVFYHLRYPLLALDILARRTRRLLVFQTLSMPGNAVFTDTQNHPIEERAVLLEPGWPKMAFIEHRFADDPTNWWVPNHACVEAMLRSSGLRVIARPGDEIYLCEPGAEAWPDWQMAELLAATGAVHTDTNDAAR